MSKSREKAKREAELIKKMSGDYPRFLTTHKQGGDWTLSELMGTINEKIKTVIDELDK